MSAELFSDLGWLPRPPDNFASDCRRIAGATAPGAIARSLANYGLDGNQLRRLGEAITRASSGDRGLDPLIPFKLGVISNGTFDLVIPMLVGSAARHGLALSCIQSDYGQVVQQALDPSSRVNAAQPDAVLLAIDHRGLPLRFVTGDTDIERADVADALSQIEKIRNSIHANTGAICLVQTLPPPPEAIFGSLDRLVAGTPRHQIDLVNVAIRDSVVGSEDVILDVAALAETVGLGAWHSPALWNMAKLPFDESFMPLYAEHVARAIAALRGRSRKCLILDLDNTLWGGVIGDDGLEGIKIAQGDATGEAYLAVQHYALALRNRGVVLAVSSKNSDEIARAPFREHPEMLLKEEHFAVFQANWSDKATNIKAIAKELSLGLDAMVFLDDNPVERALIRQTLPDVSVPELPEDPALFVRTLAAAGYFEAVTFSSEDRNRAAMYQSNARRVALQKQAVDLDSYLASLDMEIVFAPFDQMGRARISQLINKSNQFNLTTRRYSELEVAAAQEDPEVFTLQVRLVDTFGDNGMICAVICRPTGVRSWAIDTWLMSCRVLGRKVEQMVLREILISARLAGIDSLVGEYRPTAKNALVREHYRHLGFDLVAEQLDGTSVWHLSTSADILSAPMKVRRAGSSVLSANRE